MEALALAAKEAQVQGRAKTAVEAQVKAATEALAKASATLDRAIAKAPAAKEELIAKTATAVKEAQEKARIEQLLFEAQAKAAAAKEEGAQAEAQAQVEAAVISLGEAKQRAKAAVNARSRASMDAQTVAANEAQAKATIAKEKARLEAAIALGEAVAKAATEEEKEALVKAAEDAAEEARERAAISPALVCDLATYKRHREIYKNMKLPSRPPSYTFNDEDPDDPHYQHYLKLYKESEGYYIPKVPNGVKLASMRPRPVADHHFNVLESHSRNALNWYNKEKKENETYEFVKVECGGHAPSGCGLKYRIAFIARGSVSGEVPFRAVILDQVGDVITVQHCEKAAESCAKFTRLNGGCC